MVSSAAPGGGSSATAHSARVAGSPKLLWPHSRRHQESPLPLPPPRLPRSPRPQLRLRPARRATSGADWPPARSSTQVGHTDRPPARSSTQVGHTGQPCSLTCRPSRPAQHHATNKNNNIQTACVWTDGSTTSCMRNIMHAQQPPARHHARAAAASTTSCMRNRPGAPHLGVALCTASTDAQPPLLPPCPTSPPAATTGSRPVLSTMSARRPWPRQR